MKPQLTNASALGPTWQNTKTLKLRLKCCIVALPEFKQSLPDYGRPME